MAVARASRGPTAGPICSATPPPAGPAGTTPRAARARRAVAGPSPGSSAASGAGRVGEHRRHRAQRHFRLGRRDRRHGWRWRHRGRPERHGRGHRRFSKRQRVGQVQRRGRRHRERRGHGRRHSVHPGRRGAAAARPGHRLRDHLLRWRDRRGLPLRAARRSVRKSVSRHEPFWSECASGILPYVLHGLSAQLLGADAGLSAWLDVPGIGPLNPATDPQTVAPVSLIQDNAAVRPGAGAGAAPLAPRWPGRRARSRAP